MVKGLYAAWSGMVNAQERMDILSNNLANSDTIGYKKEGTTSQSFDDKLALKIKDTSSAGLVRGIGIIHPGVKIGETYTDYSQGNLQITDNMSDLAISGEGFFALSHTSKITGETTVKYTRNGEFTVDRYGYFRDTDGNYLLNRAGAEAGVSSEQNFVRVNPLLPYTIDTEGNIWQDNANVGNVGVVDFDNYDFLSKYGENFYDLLPGANVIPTNAELEQGAIEASNVNIVDEMVQMITISRAYEAAQKMIQTEDSTLDKAANTGGRVG